MKPTLVFSLALSFLFSTVMLSSVCFAQSLTTGDIAGTILDPTGAAVPNATVSLTNNETGAKQTTTTNSTGAYRFPLLNPGSYLVNASAQGFQAASENTVTVSVGQITTADIHLTVQAASTTVEVSGGGNVVQTENANVSTNITPEQIANIPNPGNDLTYYAQNAPGATMNTQAGYGNSATYGISGTSNLFTVDGMNENDPFLNLSNSGATNLLLGSNDIREATVVSNGYSGEYGELAGMNVNYVTRSGSNRFHGNAEYFWNGRVLNANDWFNNHTTPVTPRPFDNANQWAASVGGPIIKNKTFFFVDTEGLRLLIPTVGPVNVPSPAFEASTLANLPKVGNAAEVPFYNQLFSVYNGASGYSRAANVLPAGGCDGGVTLAGGAPCALQFQSSLDNLTDEWLLTTRIDQNFGSKDRAFVHFRTDHGLQATFTDPLNPLLNALSKQPQYEGQLQETHTVGANSINQFILSGSWYSAVFSTANLVASQALVPYDLDFLGGELQSPGSATGSTEYGSWPQGRNATQYQISDDYSWLKGKHSLKFGMNFRRNDITDYTPGGFEATVPLAQFSDLSSFYNGTATTYEQAFATRPTEPIALYALGFYAQDEWSVLPRLKITLALRAEHNSNPVCQTNCFARLSNAFDSISHDPAQPYNQAILTNLHQAFPNYQGISWEPRFGFAWQPLGAGNTVIRGGVGIFADVFPGTIASSFDTNSPLKNTFVAPGVATNPVTGVTTYTPLAPGVPGSLQSTVTGANAAFTSGFRSGLNIAQIEAGPGGTLFSPPAITNSARNIHYPTYQEWNLEVQQPIGSTMSLSVDYVGNHGSYLALVNPELNTYCNATAVTYDPASSTPCLGALDVSAFAGLPTAPLDSRFTAVSEASNPGVSNYNGVTVEFTRHMSRSLQVQASYTWSHALDDISNGGFLPFNFDTNFSILSPQDPSNLRLYNYGNADYDSRHQFNASYVYNTPNLRGVFGALLDWTVSGTFFVRTGLPFTVIDSADTGVLGSYNYGPSPTGFPVALFANSAVGPISCGPSGATTPCLTASQFPSAVGPGGIATFGAQRRNQVYGPGFFDTDLTLLKTIPIPHWEGAKFQFGAQAFNVLNHPNFDQPIGDIANPQFGSIVRTVATPTSIFGSFLGADASPRALQIKAQLTF
ncbi:MAG: carboxypeptidase regulatory-like domain-containing protein [Candidatus Sulfotelmatobacter sp.]